MLKNTRKKGPTGKHFRVFSSTLKTIFWTENVTQRWTKSGPFFQNQGTFVAAYASISLYTPKYPWKCMNKLLWLCQASEYVWSSYIFDRLLEMPQVLNMPGFWIWHACKCLSLEYVWIWLNMPQMWNNKNKVLLKTYEEWIFKHEIFVCNISSNTVFLSFWKFLTFDFCVFCCLRFLSSMPWSEHFFIAKEVCLVYLWLITLCDLLYITYLVLYKTWWDSLLIS